MSTLPRRHRKMDRGCLDWSQMSEQVSVRKWSSSTRQGWRTFQRCYFHRRARCERKISAAITALAPYCIYSNKVLNLLKSKLASFYLFWPHAEISHWTEGVNLSGLWKDLLRDNLNCLFKGFYGWSIIKQNVSPYFIPGYNSLTHHEKKKSAVF